MSTTAPQPPSIQQPEHLQQPGELTWAQWAVEMAAYLEEVWIAPALRGVRRLLVRPGPRCDKKRTLVLHISDLGTRLRDTSLEFRDRLRSRLLARPLATPIADEAVPAEDGREVAEPPASWAEPTEEDDVAAHDRSARRSPAAVVEPGPNPEASCDRALEELACTTAEAPAAAVDMATPSTAQEWSRQAPTWAGALRLAIRNHKKRTIVIVLVTGLAGAQLCGVPLAQGLGVLVLATMFCVPVLYMLRLIGEMTGLVKDPDEWHDWKQDLTETPVAPQRDGRPDPDLVSLLENQPLPRRNRLAQAYRYPRQKLIRR